MREYRFIINGINGIWKTYGEGKEFLKLCNLHAENGFSFSVEFRTV